MQTFGLAASVYSTGRSLLVPSPLTGVAGSLESTVTSLSLPVIHAVQDQSGRVGTFVVHCCERCYAWRACHIHSSMHHAQPALN